MIGYLGDRNIKLTDHITGYAVNGSVVVSLSVVMKSSSLTVSCGEEMDVWMAVLATLVISEQYSCYWMIRLKGLLTLNTILQFRHSVILTVVLGKVMVPSLVTPATL